MRCGKQLADRYLQDFACLGEVDLRGWGITHGGPRMIATSAVAIAVFGVPVPSDSSSLRYEVPHVQDRGPVERDLRYYPSLPDPHDLRSFVHVFGMPESLTPSTEKTLDPADGKSTLQWDLPSDAWTVEAKGNAWTQDGSRWIQLEVRGIYDLVTGESVLEIDLESLPWHISVDSIDVMVEWRPIPTGGTWVEPERHVIRVHIQESRLPGDFDRDGTLTLSDLDAYSTAFAAEAPRADLNRDGQVDAEDLRIYLATFEANFRP